MYLVVEGFVAGATVAAFVAVADAIIVAGGDVAAAVATSVVGAFVAAFAVVGVIVVANAAVAFVAAAVDVVSEVVAETIGVVAVCCAFAVAVASEPSFASV